MPSQENEKVSSIVVDSESVQFVVDGHVHLYSKERAAAQVRAAFDRLHAKASKGVHKRVMPVLLVLDTSKYRVFSSLYASAPVEGGGGLIRSPDKYGLLMVEDGHLVGMLVGGVQIAAREGIEVLGIGCNIPIQELRPAEEVIAAVREANGLPILPWAFGKWIGARGQKVCRVLRDDGDRILLGDNALRPMPSPRPRQFRLAQQENRPVLPGSDPLPLDGDDSRIGSYGFEFDGLMSSGAPVSSFLNELAQLHKQPRTLGRRLGWMGSLVMQLRIRIQEPVTVPRSAS
jgi:hypothetical protein